MVGGLMNIIQDFNNDGKIDWVDFLLYGLVTTGNIIFTIFNIIN